jgi:hypothetical protein
MRATRHGCTLLRAGVVVAVAVATLAAAGQAWAQQPLTALASGSLAFGRFAAATGGSVTVSAAGVRTAAGSVALLSSAPGSAAQVAVSGEPNKTYSITLPADVVLSNAAGQTMQLQALTSQPSGGGQLGASGSQVLTIGATLVVPIHQPVGSYSGSFSVSLDYN